MARKEAMSGDKDVWFEDDNKREPKVSFDRQWPWGKDIDVSRGAASCLVELPWVVPCCGLVFVECKSCGQYFALTVAGRVDDPRTVRFACKIQHEAGHA